MVLRNTKHVFLLKGVVRRCPFYWGRSMMLGLLKSLKKMTNCSCLVMPVNCSEMRARLYWSLLGNYSFRGWVTTPSWWTGMYGTSPPNYNAFSIILFITDNVSKVSVKNRHLQETYRQAGSLRVDTECFNMVYSSIWVANYHRCCNVLSFCLISFGFV